MLAYHSQPSDRPLRSMALRYRCELAVEEARETGAIRSRRPPRNAIRSASFGMVLNRRVPSRVACSANQPRAGSCLAVVKLEQLS
jgi:hypothetical protein